jgi:hypothetical protein
VFVSDQTGTGDPDFAAASRSVGAALPAGTQATYIERADGGTTESVRARVLDAINSGPALVNFMGHGSDGSWTGAQLLRGPDAAALSNGSRLPVFVLMTCLNGRYQSAVADSLAEALLKAPRGGAVAVWASSGMTSPDDHRTINREFYRQLFEGAPAPTLGEAVRRAKQLSADRDVRRTWILFGDPSMRLR